MNENAVVGLGALAFGGDMPKKRSPEGVSAKGSTTVAIFGGIVATLFAYDPLDCPNGSKSEILLEKDVDANLSGEQGGVSSTFNPPYSKNPNCCSVSLCKGRFIARPALSSS